MAQYDFGTIDPNTKSGTALATDLNSWRNALHSTHGGSSAPSYITAGMLWLDTTSANYELKLYDGAQSIPVAVIDATNNVARVAVDPAETSYITSTTSGQIQHIIAGSAFVTVNSTGVGIGTSSPGAKLDVAVAGEAIRISGSASTGYIRSVASGTNQWYIGSGGNTGLQLYAYQADPITFHTNATERARIDSSGNLLVGGTSDSPHTAGGNPAQSALLSGGRILAAVTSDAVMELNRTSTDGTIVNFRQAATVEGSISVSGTTVSYNGGHLSRWAQFPDNSRPELLKGTVMSNLDQMSNWDNEDNEQLNCVQVSTVEGDANVAGVFVDWDSTDDGYNDILLAMTGDMVIRIGAGVTVARGDLLMSAGDGTAKPQGDDIVRSKTIAKVTSTHVSHTYADGSYAVPCVLMAC